MEAALSHESQEKPLRSLTEFGLTRSFEARVSESRMATRRVGCRGAAARYGKEAFGCAVT